MSGENIQQVLLEMGKRARRAAAALAILPDEAKRSCLNAMADALNANAALIMEYNARDLAKARSNNLASAMIDRLTLNEKRINAMADGLRTVAKQHDPVGRVLNKTIRDNGLEITKISVPFGVIGIIYEARPNVTSDASGICIKAGNAVILRGGSEAFESNTIIAKIMNEAAVSCGLPAGTVQLLPWTDREAVKLMLKMDKYIDLVIPRGGEGLIRTVTAEATMPVLKHYKGVCHLFVDETCDTGKAVDIIVNAKCQRPGTCNALECLLVHREIAADFLKKLYASNFLGLTFAEIVFYFSRYSIYGEYYLTIGSLKVFETLLVGFVSSLLVYFFARKVKATLIRRKLAKREK